MENSTKAGATRALETAQERVILIKAGLTGKEIERLYIQCHRPELIGVNWLEELVQTRQGKPEILYRETQYYFRELEKMSRTEGSQSITPD